MPTKKNLKKVNLRESFKQGGTIGRQQEFSTEPQLKSSTGYVFPYEKYDMDASTQAGEFRNVETADNFTVNVGGTQVDMPIDRDEFGNVDYTTQYNELPPVVVKPEGSFVQYRIPTNRALLNKNKEYQDQQLYVEDDSTQSQQERLSNFVANNPNLTDKEKRIAQNKIAREKYLQYNKILGGADAWTDTERSGAYMGDGPDLENQERVEDPNYYSSIADFRETIGKPFTAGLAMTPLVIAGGPAALNFGRGALNTIGTVLNTPLVSSAPYITAGNALNTYFGGDFLFNRAPKIPGLIADEEYGQAALETGLGALDVAGMGALAKSAKVYNTGRNISRNAPSLNFVSNYRSGRNIFGTAPRKGYVDAYTLEGVQTIPKDKAMIFNRIEDAKVTSDLMDRGAYETGNWFESTPRAFYNEKVKTVGTFGDNMTLLNPSDKRRAIMGYMDEGTYDAFNVARSTDVAKDMSGGFGFPIAETEMVFPPSLTNMMRDQGKGRFFKTTIGNQQKVADDLFNMYYDKPTIKEAGGTITTKSMDGKELKRINMPQSFKQGGMVGRHQDISTINKSDIVLPGRRNIHTGEYVKPAEGIDPTTYISDALNEFDQLRTTAGQNKVVNILTNDPTLTLQEAVDQAGYGRSSWLMGLTPYAPFGKQYLPEEAIEFSRMRDYTPMELLNDEWFMSNYGDQIRAGFSGQFKGMGETLKGVGESIKDVFTTKPPVDVKQGGGAYKAQDAKGYVDPMKYKPVVGDRKGARKNPDGSESTHLMAYAKVDKLGGYVVFPTLFQNEQGGFYEPEDPIAEAINKNEIYRFGNDLESAKEFAAGSWKSIKQEGGLFENPITSAMNSFEEAGNLMIQNQLTDMLSRQIDDTFGFNFIPRDENGCEIEIVFQAQEGGYSRNQGSIFSNYLKAAQEAAAENAGEDAGFIGSVINASIEMAKKAKENKTESTPAEDPVKLTPAQTNALNISSAIDKVAGENQDLRALLYTTAYMENTFGANPNAYGRDYTHSFMSLDDPAINQIFDVREGATKHTKGQEAIFKMYENLGLPSDKESIIKLLDQDDPLASVATARAYYATVPTALPSASDSEGLFNYFSENYNKGGQSKYQTDDEALKRFNLGYSKLSSQYDFENGGTVPPEILVSPAGVFDPNYIAGEPVIVPTTRGIIAMDGVEIDLVGVSDLGEIRYLPANSGNHQFRGTNIVEYPADVFYGKDGGLADWFKEEWVRIDTEGNITGPCGTMKKGKATTRCLPRKKAQSLTKAERKATARKKVRGSKKGKQFVANTRKAKVTKKDTKRG